MRKDLKQEISALPIEEKIRKIRPTKRLKNYSSSSRFNTQKSLTSFPFSSLTETMSTSIIEFDLIKIEKSARSSEEENESIKSYQQQDSNENISAVGNQSRSERSSTTVSTLTKSPKVLKIIENNEPNKSSTFYYQENEFVSTLPTRIHVVKLPRNKVSPSFETGVNTLSSNQIPSTEINRNVLVKTISSRSKEACHTSRTNTKVDNDMRRRASTFDKVTVSRVKIAHNVHKPFMKHSMNIIRSNSDQKETSNRVTVVSVNKQQL
ncbi:unnamed protein product [Didymodactylos carnosus]|uniref:Uncharacterized protein n=2 Tax=Didymodactylos carnosus TaxID=1234261 RepID=A0A815PKG2_9BILA|nr:unnamed protein product [Didymodactylos carnosus]CAF4323953.1 unnamed protein product [Didymodactylos carnosus]